MLVGVTIDKAESLKPVTETELRCSVYEILTVLKILFESSHGYLQSEADTSSGAISFQGTTEQIELLERSAMWQYIYPMYQFAELGEPIEVITKHISNILGDLSKWITATTPILSYDGTDVNQAVHKLIYKFIARLKINYFNNDKQNPIEENDAYQMLLEYLDEVFDVLTYYPETHRTHLTLVELTLLAGMGNIRSVRNAQFSKTDPLAFIKEGNKVLITVEEARRWLQGRNGFVPTQGITY